MLRLKGSNPPIPLTVSQTAKYPVILTTSQRISDPALAISGGFRMLSCLQCVLLC